MTERSSCLNIIESFTEALGRLVCFQYRIGTRTFTRTGSRESGSVCQLTIQGAGKFTVNGLERFDFGHEELTVLIASLARQRDRCSTMVGQVEVVEIAKTYLDPYRRLSRNINVEDLGLV